MKTYGGIICDMETNSSTDVTSARGLATSRHRKMEDLVVQGVMEQWWSFRILKKGKTLNILNTYRVVEVAKNGNCI